MLARRHRALTVSPSMQHYLRAIHELQEERGHARVTDVAERLQVGKAAVSLALRTLRRDGFIRHQSYQGVGLTQRGLMQAKQVTGRFAILRRFLEDVLGVSPEQALVDACLLEHFVSAQTVDRLLDLIRFSEQDDSVIRETLTRFRVYKRGCESPSTCPACEFDCDASIGPKRPMEHRRNQ
ncbi:MAG: metal-dependent transcriptional regulator [candidate division NC10 bacterium]|nr:metal-dependent transcriptional regulator [candidate division NC10 bacterium]